VRCLIINADGYGFTEGISRAIEECVAFGTVRSLSANVNFSHADGLSDLVARYPFLSVGCHLNPIVGRPVLDPAEVPSLVDADGNFFYGTFASRFRGGQIRLDQLRAELIAQIARTRRLAGDCFSHVDFHMGLHRLPRLHPLFLEVAKGSGTGRIRTHRYRAGMESRNPRLRHLAHLLAAPQRLAKYGWNVFLRRRALKRGLSMPDYRVTITSMETRPGSISVANYRRLLGNLSSGYSELVVHPAYVDEELRRWSTYIEQRTEEREVLLDPEFRNALYDSDVTLSGYRDIP
jgi:predicted glycoside hydrolase/deacetylase ChbG (UPF0249 family)